jgi:transposase
MKQKPKQTIENFNQEIRPKLRRLFSSEEKLAIVMEAKRGEYSIVELCLKHRISEATLNKWNKYFINANKYKIF